MGYLYIYIASTSTWDRKSLSRGDGGTNLLLSLQRLREASDLVSLQYFDQSQHATKRRRLSFENNQTSLESVPRSKFTPDYSRFMECVDVSKQTIFSTNCLINYLIYESPEFPLIIMALLDLEFSEEQSTIGNTSSLYSISLSKNKFESTNTNIPAFII